MSGLRCTLCDLLPRECTCVQLLPAHQRTQPGAHPERDQAVEKLGRVLERHEVDDEPLDFRALIASMVPQGVDKLPSKAGWDRTKTEAEREQRLRDSGIYTALTDEDLEHLVGSWTEVVEGAPGDERRYLVPNMPKDTSAMRNVCNWENARSTGTRAFSVLVLLGLKGVGKTVAGGWILATHGPGLYTTAERLRASFKSFTDKERDLYNRALRARVLFVDELGRETDGETADACMFDIVNNRRGRGGRDQLWTLLASNLSEEDFRKRYDGSTVDRIEQLGVVFTCKGPNLRGRLIEQLREQAKAKRGG